MLSFTHPGLLNTQTEFVFMAEKVAESAHPWIDSWNRLLANSHAQLSYAPHPVAVLIRGGTGENYWYAYNDAAAAYQTALRWKITGDTAYADKAVEILNAWGSTLTQVTGDTNSALAGGLYGYQFAIAGEMMRDYPGWEAADFAQFQSMMTDAFLTNINLFLTTHWGAKPDHYWANWDLCNIAAKMAIGVLTDNQTTYDEAVDYFKSGIGNGNINKGLYYLHPGKLGQWQESGRDQGHSTLAVPLLATIAEIGWNQGDDLYSYHGNAILAATEYIAKYNLGYDVSYVTYANSDVVQTDISSGSRGSVRTGFEVIYNHYINEVGIAAPYTAQYAAMVRPDGGGGDYGPNSGGYDQLGFFTLTHTLDPYPEGISKPSGLTAVNFEETVKLDWWGAVYADSYNLYRATSETGPYTQIASGITDLLTYTDHGMPDGQYFYKVTGVVDGSETDFSNSVRIDTAPELIAHLEFDETSGTTAADSTGNGVTGTLENGASWAAGKSGSAVDLSGDNQYVSLPDNITEDLNDFTIAAWVNVNSTMSWMRIFDFGDSNGRYMYLTPRSSSGVARFAIGTNYWYNEDAVESTAALPTNQWVHVAVTLSGTTGRLYVNGELVDANTNMTLNPTQVGGVSQNWIGRSQYDADPYLNGQIDDLRIYDGALPAGDVYQLATQTAPPSAPAQPATLAAAAVPGNQINLSWSVTPSDYYTVKRATESGGPYYTIATRLTGTAYTDTGLAAGSTYYYEVAAANDGGEGPASPGASATALPPLPGVPANLKASAVSADTIRLTWTAASDAATYTVQRAATSGGPYTTIATGVTATQFDDPGLTAGQTWYYTVTAVNAAGQGTSSSEAAGTASDLSTWLKFDETAGTLAADATAGGWNGTLVGDPTWVTGRIENGVSLDGTDDYVSLPEGVVSGPADMTISLWVRPTASDTWSRLFDFGTGTDYYMFLTPVNGSDGDLRFAIKAGGGEQQINTSAGLPSRGWSQVVVTMSGGVGVLYLNGVEVGRNESMTIAPADLGVTTQNYLGKSQFSADPYFAGTIDDFRLLNRAVTADEVAAMVDLPDLYGDYNRDGAVDAADYTVWRDALGHGAPAFSGADGDGNGLVGEGDYLAWKSHFGETVALAALDAPAVVAVTAVADAALETTDAALAVFLPPARPAATTPVARTSAAPSAPPALTPDFTLLLIELAADAHRRASAADAPPGHPAQDDTAAESRDAAITADWTAWAPSVSL